MRLTALLVEAFAERPCQGNGAAVVRLEQPLCDAELQAVARSLNQSETAFLLRLNGQWLIRWFTPTCEVPLCGHATLAALLALGHWGEAAPGQELELRSRSGPLPVSLDANRHGTGSIVLPSGGLEPQDPSEDVLELLQRLLGEPPLAYWSSALGYRVALLSPSVPLERLVLAPEQVPDAERQGWVLMQALENGQRPSVMGRPADYQLRFFAPGLGIPEDPVTGSAHALVAPHWQQRLGRDQVMGWQCSFRPGGMLCEAASSGMIRLTGSGHLLWDGSLHLPGFGSCPDSCETGENSSWLD
jgi:PhzF family phenazine biosynthesis protein